MFWIYNIVLVFMDYKVNHGCAINHLTLNVERLRNRELMRLSRDFWFLAF